MQDFETKKLAIKDINFMGSNLMFLHLTNERIILVPLYEFPEIKILNEKQKTDFEIIDEQFLSFLSIDEIYNVKDLLGV